MKTLLILFCLCAATSRGQIQMNINPPNVAQSSGSSCGAVLTTGLVAWWPLDSALGGTSADVTGHGYTLTVVGNPVSGAAQITNGVTFDGISQYAYAAATGMPYYAPLTVSMWLNIGTGSGRPIARWDDGGSGLDWLLVINSSSPNVMFYCNNSSANCYLVSGNVPTSGWNLVTCTMDSGNNIILYTNGVLCATGAFSFANGTPAASSKVTIGAGQNGSSGEDFFGGGIDDAKVFSVALTSTQIGTIYTLGRSGCPGP